MHDFQWFFVFFGLKKNIKTDFSVCNMTIIEYTSKMACTRDCRRKIEEKYR